MLSQKTHSGLSRRFLAASMDTSISRPRTAMFARITVRDANSNRRLLANFGLSGEPCCSTPAASGKSHEAECLLMVILEEAHDSSEDAAEAVLLGFGWECA
mmetsp:Transcript_8559/g.23787  ORF Transcript_8559/g.23787 Transcript_8559/m.23787 type:complete len:101 (+) Transcript_8559:194-496(+)